MIRVTSHAAPKPTTSTMSSHDCAVGNGSPACHRSKPKAARIDTAHCSASMRVITRRA